MDVLDQLKGLGKVSGFIPLPTEEDIERVEEAIKVHFPPSYRRFQLEYSNIKFGVFEPYLMFQDGSNEDMVQGVEEARTYYNLPPHLIPFLEDNGQYYCFDIYSQSPEYKVTFWAHDFSTGETWNDFLDWGENCWIKETLANR